MSKSEVNLCKKFDIPKLASETALRSLKESIRTGKKLNYERCHYEIDGNTGAKFKHKKVKPTNFYVCKLMYPEDNVYPECDHINDIVVDRDEFSTREEYLRFLSEPKKFYQKPRPKWIRKNIPPCTAHLNELSQPKTLSLQTTLNEHRHHLTFDRVENLLHRIHFGDHQTPQEVLETLKQQLRDSKNKIHQQKCEIKKLKLKIGKSQKSKDLSAQIISKVREMVFCDRPMATISSDCQELSEKILPKLCQVARHKLPAQNSQNSTDQALIKLSNKFAASVLDYLKDNCMNSQNNKQNDSECLQLFKNLCIPIDSYYPQTLSKQDEDKVSHDETDDDTSDDTTEINEDFLSFDDINVEDESNEKMKPTKQLSFLRSSQINITLDDCKQMFNVINERNKTAAAKNASKDEKKAERAQKEKALAKEKAEKEAEKKQQEKAEAKARKKARKRKGKANCFGNLNPKPQWQVEWRETNESEFRKPSTSNSP